MDLKKCEFCDKTFSKTQDLDIHLKYHIDVCYFCNLGFSSKEALQNHCITIHGKYIDMGRSKQSSLSNNNNSLQNQQRILPTISHKLKHVDNNSRQSEQRVIDNNEGSIKIHSNSPHSSNSVCLNSQNSSKSYRIYSKITDFEMNVPNNTSYCKLNSVHTSPPLKTKDIQCFRDKYTHLNCYSNRKSKTVKKNKTSPMHYIPVNSIIQFNSTISSKEINLNTTEQNINDTVIQLKTTNVDCSKTSSKNAIVNLNSLQNSPKKVFTQENAKQKSPLIDKYQLSENNSDSEECKPEIFGSEIEISCDSCLQSFKSDINFQTHFCKKLGFPRIYTLPIQPKEIIYSFDSISNLNPQSNYSNLQVSGIQMYDISNEILSCNINSVSKSNVINDDDPSQIKSYPECNSTMNTENKLKVVDLNNSKDNVQIKIIDTNLNIESNSYSSLNSDINSHNNLVESINKSSDFNVNKKELPSKRFSPLNESNRTFCYGECKWPNYKEVISVQKLQMGLSNKLKSQLINDESLKNSNILPNINEVTQIASVENENCVIKLSVGGELKAKSCKKTNKIKSVNPKPSKKVSKTKIVKPKQRRRYQKLGMKIIKASEVVFSCNLCDKFYFVTKDLKKHIQVFHKKIICNEVFCTAFFDDVDQLNVHNNEKHERTVCDQCGKLVPLRLFNSHINNAHSNMNYDCDICKRSYKNKSNLNRHIKHHVDYREYKCDKCKSKFCNRAYLRAHLLRHTNQKFNCTKCPKSFISPVNLQTHMYGVHVDTWVYYCKICDLRCKDLKQVTTHYKTHGKKDKKKDFYYKTSSYQCEICFQYLKNEYKFSVHLKQKHNIAYRVYKKMDTEAKEALIAAGKLEDNRKIYKCKYCTKICRSKRGFDVHSKIHAKKCKFQCNICKRKFPSYLQLTSHQISHSNQINFHCEFCEFISKNKLKLRRHILKYHINK